MCGQLGKQPQSPPPGVQGLHCRPQVLCWKPSCPHLCKGRFVGPDPTRGAKLVPGELSAASWSEGPGWWLRLRSQAGGVPVGPQHLPDEELALLAHLCQAEVELGQRLVARQPFQQLLATVLQRVEERSPRVSEASPKPETLLPREGQGRSVTLCSAQRYDTC